MQNDARDIVAATTDASEHRSPPGKPGNDGLQWLHAGGEACESSETQERVLREIALDSCGGTCYTTQVLSPALPSAHRNYTLYGTSASDSVPRARAARGRAGGRRRPPAAGAAAHGTKRRPFNKRSEETAASAAALRKKLKRADAMIRHLEQWVAEGWRRVQRTFALVRQMNIELDGLAELIANNPAAG